MPIISQFYGIVITMYINEINGKHHKPHIHTRYNEYKAIYDFDLNLLSGHMPYKQNKMIETWILIHKEELETLWNLMQNENDYFKIDPLK